ncbi:MAG TPA: hypothetical protein VGY50_01435 [Streptosporangiaceae bacterium]|nr:hypothetical protein [Streptosporangiaceae bacterium]
MGGKRYSRPLTLLAAASLALGVTATMGAAARPAAGPAGAGPAGAGTGCGLGPHGSVRHVIYLMFDNTHYTRDNPNVPSDLQQMPNLLNFLTGHGTLVSHEHTPLIAHTADDSVTLESGLYGSGQGVPIANEYNYYKPDGTTDTAGSFAYWTDPIVDYNTGLAAKPVGDNTPTMIGANGRTAPAPWVPYTRAGCNFGTVASANTELENTLPDVPHVFGANSPEAKEAANPNLQSKATADFMGLAVHCAQHSAVCGPGSRPDVLAGEPGGYHGYRALYGSKFLQPVISPAGPVRNLDGQIIKNSSGDIGFPGYDGMTGVNSLAYTLDMQTHGVPVTFTYLSDLHDSFNGSGPFGPGQAGYTRQLHEENAAFGTFFTQLAAHGITRANTLFVVTSDEGDHFVGSPPAPAGCNGSTVPCHYAKIGEVDGNLTGLLAAKGITTPFDVESDSAPGIYIHGQPGRTDPAVRSLERATATLTGADLASGQTQRLTSYLADPVELKLLHMVTGDPKRTPSLVLFGNDNFWLSSGNASCGKSCFSEPKGGDAWNHGTASEQINTTWVGMVGPGVAHLGIDNSVWSDHTNIQPTMLALLGLRDDYAPDGRVLGEIFDRAALPAGMRAHRGTLLRLGQLYTQLEAPVGAFGLDTLRASTRALASNSPGDAAYTRTENQLQRIGAARDEVGARMQALLLGAEFGGRALNGPAARALIRAGDRILGRAAVLGG